MKKILAILLLVTTNTFGAKYYVKPTGNDANSGLSDLLAWQHVQKACTTVVAGDTVLIRAGTYNETSWTTVSGSADCLNGAGIGLTPMNNGTSSAPIVFKGYPGDVRPVILGNDAEAGGRATAWFTTTGGGAWHDVIFDSLEFKKGLYGVKCGPGSYNITVRYCKIDSTLGCTGENNGGVLAYQVGSTLARIARNIKVEYCELFNNGLWVGGRDYNPVHNSAGVLLYECDSCEIAYNTIYNEPKGIYAKGKPRWNDWHHNTVHDVRTAAFQTMANGCDKCVGGSTAEVRIHHNISYNNPECLRFSQESSAPIDEGQFDSLLYFYNNTCDCSNGGALGAGAGTGISSHHGYVFGAWFFNNIFYNPTYMAAGCFDEDKRGSIAICSDNTSLYPQRIYEDYNIHWGRGTSFNYYQYPFATPYTLTTWKLGAPPGFVAGQGAHSQVVDPLFTNVAARNYTPQPGSPALSGGRGGSFTFWPDSRPTTITAPTYIGAIGDSAPTITGYLSIGNVTVTEGGSAVFSVTLSTAQASNLTFSSITSSGTATGGAPVPGCVAEVDFLNSSSTRTITAGQTSTTVTVPTCDDAAVEAQEQFYVTISNPSISTVVISNNTGTGTINDNDLAPSPGNKRVELKGKVRLAGKVRVGSKP